MKKYQPNKNCLKLVKVMMIMQLPVGVVVLVVVWSYVMAKDLKPLKYDDWCNLWGYCCCCYCDCYRVKLKLNVDCRTSSLMSRNQLSSMNPKRIDCHQKNILLICVAVVDCRCCDYCYCHVAVPILVALVSFDWVVSFPWSPLFPPPTKSTPWPSPRQSTYSIREIMIIIIIKAIIISPWIGGISCKTVL